MKYVASDRVFLLDVLYEVKKKSENVTRGTELCDLAESLAAVKEGMATPTALKQRNNERHPQSQDESGEGGNIIIKDDKDTGISASRVDDELEEAVTDSSSVFAEASIEDQLSGICDELLTTVKAKATDMVMELGADEIRRLLMVFSLLPFEADEMVHAMDEELSRRMDHLRSAVSNGVQVNNLLREAATNASTVNNTLFGESKDDDSPFLDQIKNGLLKFFRSSTTSDHETCDMEAPTVSDELSAMIQNSAASTTKAAQILEEIGSAALVSTDDIIQNIEEGAAFELGRCRELVNNYRRIDFSTGTFRSRHDRERRKDIAKRVLSRLIP